MVSIVIVRLAVCLVDRGLSVCVAGLSRRVSSHGRSSHNRSSHTTRRIRLIVTIAITRAGVVAVALVDRRVMVRGLIILVEIFAVVALLLTVGAPSLGHGGRRTIFHESAILIRDRRLLELVHLVIVLERNLLGSCSLPAWHFGEGIVPSALVARLKLSVLRRFVVQVLSLWSKLRS